MFPQHARSTNPASSTGATGHEDPERLRRSLVVVLVALTLSASAQGGRFYYQAQALVHAAKLYEPVWVHVLTQATTDLLIFSIAGMLLVLVLATRDARHMHYMRVPILLVVGLTAGYLACQGWAFAASEPSLRYHHIVQVAASRGQDRDVRITRHNAMALSSAARIAPGHCREELIDVGSGVRRKVRVCRQGHELHLGPAS